MKQSICIICVACCFVNCNPKSGLKENRTTNHFSQNVNADSEVLSSYPVKIILEHWIENITGLPVFNAKETRSSNFFTLILPGKDVDGYLINLNNGYNLENNICQLSYEMVKEAKIRCNGKWYTSEITNIDYSTIPSTDPYTRNSFYETFFFVNDSVNWTHYSYKEQEGVYMSTESTGREIGKLPPLNWEIKGEIARVPVIMADVDFIGGVEQIATVSELILARNFSITVQSNFLTWMRNEKTSSNVGPDSLIYGKSTQVLAYIYSSKSFVK